MLKCLFVVIFILNTLASSAWAGMNVSQLNQAETAKMQILHDMTDMNAMDSCTTSDQKTNAQMFCMQNDNNCNNCQNFVCGAIHVSASFMAEPNSIFTAIRIANGNAIPLHVSIKYSNSQPETPPPSA